MIESVLFRKMRRISDTGVGKNPVDDQENKKKTSKNWYESLTIRICIKGYRTRYEDYMGISLVNIAYKQTEGIIRRRLFRGL